MNTDMPDEVMELMSLYPQPVRHSGGVESAGAASERGGAIAAGEKRCGLICREIDGDSVYPKINNNVSGKLGLHTSPEDSAHCHHRSCEISLRWWTGRIHRLTTASVSAMKPSTTFVTYGPAISVKTPPGKEFC